jgi:hypothetical protein
MGRVDLPETIRRIDFPENVWEWLDLFGDILGITQAEAIHQDELFKADTPFKKLLLCTLNKDLCTLYAIYILLRCELIHQASSHVRLFCESVISLKYISLDPEVRSKLFWGYSYVEAYEISSSLIAWERGRANPLHVDRLEDFLSSILEEYKNAKKAYTVIGKGGRERPFKNWCNKSIAAQARDCGPEFSRLYELVYTQLSSYIHGSAWSLRRQTSYSRKHYQPEVVLNDMAAIIRTASAVWLEWAKFCIYNLDWRLTEAVKSIPKRLEDLDSKHFPPQSTAAV